MILIYRIVISKLFCSIIQYIINNVSSFRVMSAPNNVISVNPRTGSSVSISITNPPPNQNQTILTRFIAINSTIHNSGNSGILNTMLTVATRVDNLS
jgi:hypothetical protein